MKATDRLTLISRGDLQALEQAGKGFGITPLTPQSMLAHDISESLNNKHCHFMVAVGGSRINTDRLVALGLYDWAHPYLTQRRYPLESVSHPGHRLIVLINSPLPWNEYELARTAGQFGFRLPNFEEALSFGLEHPSVQLGREVLFICRPDVGQPPAYLVFGRGTTRDGMVSRELHLAWSTDEWTSRFWIALVYDHSI